MLGKADTNMDIISDAAVVQATRPPAVVDRSAAPDSAARRPLRRLIAAAVLVAGLGGVGLSLQHPQWFSGSTSDAGVMGAGSGPIIAPGGGPIRNGSSDSSGGGSRSSRSSSSSRDGAHHNSDHNSKHGK